VLARVGAVLDMTSAAVLLWQHMVWLEYGIVFWHAVVVGVACHAHQHCVACTATNIVVL
jgi:hypothetical protein